MAVTIEAIFQNGVLKPVEPLALQEDEKVRVTVHKLSDWVSETSGLIRWTGDRQSLLRLATDPEFLPEGADADLYADMFPNPDTTPKCHVQEQQ